MKWVLILAILAIVSSQVTELRESDFSNGAYIISKPGTYVLMEDIYANPNPKQDGQHAYDANWPRPWQYTSSGGMFDDAKYALGFFAAIVIQSNDVILDLNGHKLEQAPGFALLQRFYAHIELADRPFIFHQGPHDFGNTAISAHNVVIRNGFLGRSSHHGIHGNNNSHVTIEDVVFYDYEVAAVHLNGVRNLTVRRCKALYNYKQQAILGGFSAMRFLRPYLDTLAAVNPPLTLKVQGVELTAASIRQDVVNIIDQVYEDLVVKGLKTIDKVNHGVAYQLLHNPSGLPDGNAYGFVVNRLGVAVNGFPLMSDTINSQFRYASDILFEDVVVQNQSIFVNEMPALNVGTASSPNNAHDAVGQVFQVRNRDPETDELITLTSEENSFATYKGSILANTQALVAKGILLGLIPTGNPLMNTAVNSITQTVIEWIEKTHTLEWLHDNGVGWLCNGDDMFHVNKGLLGLRIDAALNVVLRNVKVSGLTNKSPLGKNYCGKKSTVKVHPLDTQEGCNSGFVSGYSFSGSQNVRVENSEAVDLESYTASAFGFCFKNDAKNVVVVGSLVKNVQAGSHVSNFQVYDYNPTPTAKAIGFGYGPIATNVVFTNDCVKNISSPGGPTCEIEFQANPSDVIEPSCPADPPTPTPTPIPADVCDTGRGCSNCPFNKGCSFCVDIKSKKGNCINKDDADTLCLDGVLVNKLATCPGKRRL